LDEAAILTLILAAYGAGLATVQAILRVAERRRRLKVAVAWGLGMSGGRPEGSALFVVSAANTGGRDVSLSSAGFILPDSRNFMLLETPGLVLPHRLQEGANCAFWLDPRGVAVNLKQNGLGGKVRIVGYFTDTLGKKYRSEPTEFDIDSNLPATR